MKYIALFSMLITLPSFAGWVAGSKINDPARTAYSRQGVCQQKEGETCYEWKREFIAGAVKLERIEVDDNSQPIYSRREKVQSCSPKSSCLSLLDGHCDPEFSDYRAYFDEDQMRVYCSKLLGYEKKLTDKPVIVKDDALHTQKVQERAQKAQMETALEAVRKHRRAGERVIDLMILRNAQKNLDAAQRKQVLEAYASIKSLLEVGNLEAAKTEIQAVTPDGTLVTEDDKSALIAEIDKHL